MVSHILGVNVGIKNEKSMDIRLSIAVRRAFDQLIRNIDNEPVLILEGENLPRDEETTLKEIRSWLFGRKESDDCTNNSPEK
jgi:hypothetical protein